MFLNAKVNSKLHYHSILMYTYIYSVNSWNVYRKVTKSKSSEVHVMVDDNAAI